MSSYELAPATALLDTDCLCCGRALLDAASVTAGVGPVCRQNYGYNEIPDALRVTANVLIHDAARGDCDNARREEIAATLSDLGAETLAEKIRDRFMAPAVRIHSQRVTFGRGEWAREVDALVIKTAYNPAFNVAFKAGVDWRDRSVAKTDTGKFAGWAFLPTARRDVWEVLQDQFAGQILATEDGRTTIPGGDT